MPLAPRRDSSLSALATVLAPQGGTVVPFRRPGSEEVPLNDSVVTPLHRPTQAENDLARPTMKVSEDFFGGMAGLEGVAPITLEDARRRRRNLVVGLLASSVVLLVAAIVWQSFFVLAFLVSMAAFLGCVMVIVAQQRAAEMQRNRIEPIQPVGYQPPLQQAPDYLLKRSAEGL